MQSDLIFDVGLHSGEDTEFYLKKGFRVVAVEADPDLCAAAEAKFSEAIRDKRLTVVNRAVVAEPGPVTFYRNPVKTDWGTTVSDWADRGRLAGVDVQEVTVDGATMADVLGEFGVPYYMKVDIEGMDLVAVEGLRNGPGLPKYLSVESNLGSFGELRREMGVFASLGYDAFKIVSQGKVREQRQPRPAREGREVDHAFGKHSSGLFGEEAPGEWMGAEAAIEAYRPHHLRYALVGHDPLVTNKLAKWALRKLKVRADWFDTHARLAG